MYIVIIMRWYHSPEGHSVPWVMWPPPPPGVFKLLVPLRARETVKSHSDRWVTLVLSLALSVSLSFSSSRSIRSMRFISFINSISFMSSSTYQMNQLHHHTQRKSNKNRCSFCPKTCFTFFLFFLFFCRMFGSVLLCVCSFSLLRLSSSLVHGNIQLDDGPVAGRRAESSYLSDSGEYSCPVRVPWPGPCLSPAAGLKRLLIMIFSFLWIQLKLQILFSLPAVLCLCRFSVIEVMVLLSSWIEGNWTSFKGYMDNF